MSHLFSHFPRWIGVIHLEPLPGAPGTEGMTGVEALEKAGRRAVQEARELEKAGFEALIVENLGDVPYFPGSVAPETIASMAVIVATLREAVKIPVGINVLRNDARSALGIAAAVGSEFIRVNVLSGVAATDQGWIEGQAASLLRERMRLRSDVQFFADVFVKHANTVSGRELGICVEETVLRAGASAVIVTGATTGRLADEARIQEALDAANAVEAPLYVGSGVSPEYVTELKRLGAGAIIGSAFRKSGVAGNAIDPKRLKLFSRAFLARSKSKPRSQSSE